MKRYERRCRPALAGAVVCVLFSDLAAVILQFFKGALLDSAVAGQAEQALRYGLLLLTFILCEILLYYAFKRLSAAFAAGCSRLLKQDIFDRILDLDYVSYKEKAQGEYLAKYTSEADAIRARRFSLLPLFWEICFKILLVSTALFLLDTRLAIITLLLLTTPLYVPKLIEKRLQQAQTDCLRASEEALSRMNDWLSGFEIIKNFGVEQQIRARFRPVNDNTAAQLRRDLHLGAAAQLITTCISYFSYFIILACAAALVLQGRFSPGDFFVAVGMIDQLSYPLISLAEIIRQLVAVRPACAAMEDFLQQPPRPSPAPAHFLRDIRFWNVSFAYPEGPTVLRDLCLTLQKGGRYLLRGPSGCGKTTVINLLLGYYPATAGRIEMDGSPIAPSGSASRYITVVRQEAVLFHDTLRCNLTMYQDIPDQHLCGILTTLGLEKYASPAALDTVVTEGGANFSGGEKRRICLARALLRNSEILILDEPLANLDSETAQRIEDLLLSIRDRTLLVVSHQFSPEKLPQFSAVLDLSPAES